MLAKLGARFLEALERVDTDSGSRKHGFRVPDSTGLAVPDSTGRFTACPPAGRETNEHVVSRAMVRVRWVERSGGAGLRRQTRGRADSRAAAGGARCHAARMRSV